MLGRSGCSSCWTNGCGGVFDEIDAVIPPAERDEFMSRYKAAAGFAKEKLNGAPSIIPPGARVHPA